MSDAVVAKAMQMAQGAPMGLDLTDGSQLSILESMATRLLENGADSTALADVERQLIFEAPPTPLMVHLAVKLARSKLLTDSIDRPTRLSVVFAMYKEHRRILPRTVENRVGEDFLRRKAAQLDWLTRENSQLEWRLLAVDDGCPEGSGRIAREIAAEMGETERIEVLFLDEAIRRQEPVTQPMDDPSESRKGGSILFGMSRAAAEAVEGEHIVLFTDADLSTHLGQSGLLMEPILTGTTNAAIGSRREATSVVVKQGRRNTRGKLFIYLWKQLLPVLQDVVDTQCGFKAFRGDVARRIVLDSLEKGFAFDIELLLRTELATAGSITKVPIAWIDSEAASTTTDLEPYLPMLRTTVALYRHYLSRDPRSESFALLIESLDDDSWNRLVDRMPAAIAQGDPTIFGRESHTTAADLESRIRAGS